MKIQGPGRINTPSKPKKSSQSAGGSGFADALGGTQGPAAKPALSGAGPVAAIDAILSIQAVDDATSGRSRGLAQGRQMLDALEGLRRGILLGTVPVNQLQRIVASVEKRRDEFTDPALKSILDDIELRARVELAKLGIAL